MRSRNNPIGERKKAPKKRKRNYGWFPKTEKIPKNYNSQIFHNYCKPIENELKPVPVNDCEPKKLIVRNLGDYVCIEPNKVAARNNQFYCSKLPTKIQQNSPKPNPPCVINLDDYSVLHDYAYVEPNEVVVPSNRYYTSKCSANKTKPAKPKKKPNRMENIELDMMYWMDSPRSFDSDETCMIMINGDELEINPENVVPVEYDFENNEFGELTYDAAYSDYEPSVLKIGRPHPYAVIESRSMSTMKAPEIRYRLKIPDTIIDKAILSNVQLEAIVYACQKHEEYLKDGRRAGFLIGDGAGVGKGRTVAGIIYENYLAGRNKAIWLSVSNDLKEDAIRDLNDVGREMRHEMPVKAINKMTYAKIDSKPNGDFSEGVLFVTYSSLISRSSCASKRTVFKSRLEQIIDWFGEGYDGVIVFDESHKAKNLHAGKKNANSVYEKKTSKTGAVVKELQDCLMHARVVYASATGATEPKHMAYMVRLGLWGPGNSFKEFDEFESTLTRHGVGAMELIAIEMKMKGVYLARQLSFRDVKFEIQEIMVERSTINGYPLRTVYDKCVELWTLIHNAFIAAFHRNDYSSRIRATFTAQFWGSHQRFFKYLCMSAKIKECVRIIDYQVYSGKCVVLGLQSTGEARTAKAIEDAQEELDDFVSSAEGVVKALVESFYPSKRNLRRHIGKMKEKNTKKGIPVRKDGSETDSDDDGFVWVRSGKDAISSMPDNQVYHYERQQPIIQNHVYVESLDYSEDGRVERQILQAIDNMQAMFPLNVLDQLIHELGGPSRVAEMTGRKGRMVETNGKVSYESRKEVGYSLEKMNILEKNRFNGGERLIGIISDAASTGISLHSDKRFRNQRQRVHITLELPWSADKAIQQFGRTHRSNQVVPPHYIFLISDLAGEKRFAATVAKRLESLGALTHGDRRCADRDLSQFNLDNEFGYKSVLEIVSSVFQKVTPAVPYPAGLLKKCGKAKTRVQAAIRRALVDVGIESDVGMTVPKFLNRILGLGLDMQNGLFEHFLDIVEYKSSCAKARNEFDHGIRDIMNKDDNIYVEETEVLKIKSASDNDDIKVHKVINVANGISWDVVLERFFRNSKDNQFCVSKRGSVKILALAEHYKNDEFKLVTIIFPPKTITRRSLQSSYEKIGLEDAKKQWERIYRESKDNCLHTIDSGQCQKENCSYGKRTKVSYIITGAVFLAWKLIRTVHHNLKMEIIRVELKDGTKLIGALVYAGNYSKFMRVLERHCESLFTENPEPPRPSLGGRPILTDKSNLIR